MALQTEPHTVELVYAGQEVTVTELRADMYNERQRVEISLVKTMETDTLFGIGQRDELTHVTFGLYAAEKLVAADGSSIPQDGLIEMVSLNKDGKAMCKTTSDGKKEGFAFRITGANGYDMTFTTDAKGEIFIEKLRIGEYTVTELKNSASEGYKIADPVKITLVANETLTVKIHNDKTKVDVPKTGDDADLILWISLLGLAAAGAGCTAFFYLKKRRTSKHIAAKK